MILVSEVTVAAVLLPRGRTEISSEQPAFGLNSPVARNEADNRMVRHIGATDRVLLECAQHARECGL